MFILLILVLIVRIAMTPLIFIPFLRLQTLSPDSKASQEAHESDSAEDAPRESFTLGADSCSDGEESSG